MFLLHERNVRWCFHDYPVGCVLDFFFFWFIYFYSRDVIFISGEISWQWRLISKAFMLAAISLHPHKTSTVKSLGLIYNQKMITVLCFFFFLKHFFYTNVFCFFPSAVYCQVDFEWVRKWVLLVKPRLRVSQTEKPTAYKMGDLRRSGRICGGF